MAWSPIGKFEWPIAWALLTGVPATASRWPTWGEVTGKPSFVSTHNPQFTGLANIGGSIDVGYQMSPDGGRVVRLAATSTPNTGLYDATNGQWLLRIAGDNRVYVVGGEVWHSGTFNPATKLNNSGDVTHNGSITAIGPFSALQVRDRDSARNWGVYGSGDILHFWNGTANILDMASDGTFFRGSGSLGIGSGTGGSSVFGSPYGTVDIGAKNSGYCHFYTSTPAFYMDKPLEVNGGIFHYGGPAVPRTYVQAADPGAVGAGAIWIRPV